AHKFVDRAAVFELFIYIAWLTRTSEPGKAGPARSNTPRRNCYAEGLASDYQIFDVDVPALQHSSEMIVVFFKPRSRLVIVFSDKPLIDFKTRSHNSSGSDPFSILSCILAIERHRAT